MLRDKNVYSIDKLFAATEKNIELSPAKPISIFFIGLMMFLVVHAVLMITPLALVGVVVISIMGLICFIPFALFVHWVL